MRDASASESNSTSASATAAADDDEGKTISANDNSDDREAGPSSPRSSQTLRHQEPLDPDLLASYPIYLSTSLPPSSFLHLLQYPTFPRNQPLPVPDVARQRGLTQAIRWRPQSGWVQVELPLDLRRSVYDEEKGGEMGKGAHAAGGEIGSKTTQADSDDDDISSGKRSGKKKKKAKKEEEAMDLDGLAPPKRLEKIRLESEVMPPMTHYCVGVMRDQALHLTHLDRVVQLRPSMHHLDGLDTMEAQAKRMEAKANADEEGSDNDEAAAAAAAKKKKPTSVNVTVKGEAGQSGGQPGRGGPGGGAGPMDAKDTLMAAKRLAEAENWVDLEWRDAQGRHAGEVKNIMAAQLFAGSKRELKCTTKARDYLPPKE
ncbi:hypothetical protein BDZ90DRAFT_217884 [Jaminaea rosea]|uniref:Sin-like protein conserved region-domain-containing protein n=1 Tax=Jaminaea rosea TaxID=1569628 RepID=A0A316UUZ6_9BASI|nr:hypothetical protein BDZ90DRAFT_217884 [Jaminaea rosea]PWN28824.1 hypothetical protein BDZ90DRAFT_217884 [Jaminaea rosea]